jgi:exoribonuclease-2
MVAKNSLVLYKQDAAVVTEVAEKLTIAAKGGTLKVREKDVALICPNAPALKTLVDGAAAFLARPEVPGKIAEAWELLADEPGKTVSLAEIVELAFGKFAVADAFGYFSAARQSPYFTETLVTAPGAAVATVAFIVRSREEVTVAVAKAAAKVVDGEKRAAFLERLKAKHELTPDDTPFMQEVEAVALGLSTKSRVLADLGILPESEKAHRLLLDTGFWTNRKNPYPARYGLSAKSATDALGPPPAEERTTVPHTAFAIDNAWSSDPDDAVFFDGTHLWVHIADPAAAVTPDSPIDSAARNRGATLYLPEGASRMLAEESLADYALGLSPLSHALSFKIPLSFSGDGDDATLTIGECAVLKTLVPVARLTYEEAVAKKGDAGIAPLFDIADRNRRRRAASGAASITLPEVHIHVDVESSDPDEAIKIEPVAHNAGADMVQEMMLLAGEAAAKFAFNHKIPFPYASQEAPEFPPELPDGLAGEFQRVKCMQKKTISTSPGMHSGLGLAMYSQVTSPLRRYGDLVAHQQLRAFIDGKPLLDTETVLERILQGDAASVASVKAERKSNLHWTLVYLLEHPGWTGEAVVVDLKTPYQAVVLIPSLARQTVVNTAKKSALNDVLVVRPGKISLPDQSFLFVEV